MAVVTARTSHGDGEEIVVLRGFIMLCVLPVQARDQTILWLPTAMRGMVHAD